MMSTSTNTFIGRSQEIAVFNQWLDDADAPSILYVHDPIEETEKKGGIGKTWLLRRFYELAKQHHDNTILVMVDFFNIGDRNGVVIAEKVGKALKERYPHWSSEDFEKLLQEYHEIVNGQKADETLLEKLVDALTNDLKLLQPQMLESNTHILLFFDTYECIEHCPIAAILRPTQTFPDMYQSSCIRTIIAGRNALDWTHQNWVGREQEVQTLALAPLSQSEMVDSIDLELSPGREIDAKQIEILYERTEGRPILIGLVTDMLNKQVVTLEHLTTIPLRDFESHLVMQINNLEKPLNWVILFMAHAYHRFNYKLLNWLLREADLKPLVSSIQYNELVRELRVLSFVRKSKHGDDFVLHDEMRRLVNQYCWQISDQSGCIRRKLSSLTRDYYSELISHEENQETCQNYTVEKLFHELFLDIESGFQSFERHFNHAIDFSLRTFARALLQELQKFVPALSDELHQTMKLAEARILRVEENPEAALLRLADLEQDAVWAKYHQIALLEEKGICYLQLNHYPQAIECFKTCLAMKQSSRDTRHYSLLLNQLNDIHHLQERYTQCDEEALRVQSTPENSHMYADIPNNMSNVLHLQGELEEALRRCKVSLFKRAAVNEETFPLLTKCLAKPYREKAFEYLPWLERNCLLLYADAELSQADIAEILSLDKKAVQRHLMRATDLWLQAYTSLLEKEFGISLNLRKTSTSEYFLQVKRLIQG